MVPVSKRYNPREIYYSANRLLNFLAYQLVDMDVDGKIIFKCFVKKVIKMWELGWPRKRWGGKKALVWTDFVWPRKETSSGLLWTRQRILGFHKSKEFPEANRQTSQGNVKAIQYPVLWQWLKHFNSPVSWVGDERGKKSNLIMTDTPFWGVGGKSAAQYGQRYVTKKCL